MKKISRRSISNVAAAMAVFAVAIAPIGASAATSSTTVSATVASYIDVSSGATAAMGTVTPGSATPATATNTVTVNSNDLDGYTLSIQSTDSTATLDGPNGNTIAASTGTHATPVALAENTWGYRLSTYTASNYAGVTSAPVQIKTTATTASADTTVLTYATRVSTSKPAGAYSDSVTYTALVR